MFIFCSFAVVQKRKDMTENIPSPGNCATLCNTVWPGLSLLYSYWELSDALCNNLIKYSNNLNIFPPVQWPALYRLIWGFTLITASEKRALAPAPSAFLVSPRRSMQRPFNSRAGLHYTLVVTTWNGRWSSKPADCGIASLALRYYWVLMDWTEVKSNNPSLQKW